MKNIILSVTLSLIFGFMGAYFFSKTNNNDSQSIKIEGEKAILASLSEKASEGNLNFVLASKVSTPSVVFIKTTSMVQRNSGFGWFFDGWDPFGSIGQVSSTGSGVIVRKDGYIVTNLHVIKDASKIEVVLNNQKKTYSAELIGSDPSTDLALLKIEASNLTAISFSNSDKLEIGEWVVAVGNPFNLTSTVTAGIVSAKGRNINILNSQFPIESFIQTDAAINPGNSGGALVNLKGELVGINTAIFSKTGSYTGYGFAIPANIVAKTIKDLIDFGKILRGTTGMEIGDIDEQTEKKSKISDGALIINVWEGTASDKAGLKKGDVITKIQDNVVNSKSSYDEQLSYYRPGDKIKINFNRNGENKETTLVLTNEDGEFGTSKNKTINSKNLGADFTPISKIEQQKYRIQSGIKVSNLKNGLIAQLGLEDGFIITKFNGKEYTDAQELIEAIEKARGRIQIEGKGTDGGTRYYNFYY